MNEACGMEERRSASVHEPRSPDPRDILAIGSRPTEARRARLFAERVVGNGNVRPERRDLVLVAVSELVTNALVHGAAPRTLSMTRRLDEVDVVVSDGSPEFPHLRSAGATEPGGHGLHVVDRISDGWGVRPVASGKEVWCRIHLGQG